VNTFKIVIRWTLEGEDCDGRRDCPAWRGKREEQQEEEEKKNKKKKRKRKRR
jgi:hypothetical protein